VEVRGPLAHHFLDRVRNRVVVFVKNNFAHGHAVTVIKNGCLFNPLRQVVATIRILADLREADSFRFVFLALKFVIIAKLLIARRIDNHHKRIALYLWLYLTVVFLLGRSGACCSPYR